MLNFIKRYPFSIVVAFISFVLFVMPTNGLEVAQVACCDKIVHLLIYFTLVVAIFWDKFRVSRGTFNMFKILIIMFAATLFGAFIEIIQFFLPYRSASLYDLLADLLGAFIGIIVCKIVMYKKIMNNAKKR
ncbi:MAG: VanZ family protein [Prevotellaceae bacterium]|jgi:VanZ family protein|nr:VanZ family protein [Prevotellaceae bacterium]